MSPEVTMTKNPLKEVLKLGQSIWYDGLVSREAFSRLIEEDGIRGATTNPTIFEKAIAAGEYDKVIADLRYKGDPSTSSGRATEFIYRHLAGETVQGVCDTFLPVFKESNGEDGFVSIEVSPLLAYDTQKTIAEAKELHQLVNRENVMIKVPATAQGIPAIETLIAEGISVNITLIFSNERYAEVMEAYLRGLEKRVKAGKSVASIASVASFFVSRVDAAIDARLQDRALKGEAAIANSKIAYKNFKKFFSGERFQKLKKLGTKAQRPLWASTGTKSADYSDVLYVESLIGPETVNTIPPPTLAAFKDHGRAALTLEKGQEKAQSILTRLAKEGIDLSFVTKDLETKGVELFVDSYKKIIERLEARLK